jgi:hypothetical protein
MNAKLQPDPKDYGLLMTLPLQAKTRAGKKTATRRLPVSTNSLINGSRNLKEWPRLDFSRAWVDPGPSPAGNSGPYLKVPMRAEDGGDEVTARVYPQWRVGDRLWVREGLRETGRGWVYSSDRAEVLVDEAHGAAMASWVHHKETEHCSPLHMPKWACRLWLEVTAVRPERLQGITAADVIAEGFDVPDVDYAVIERPDFLDAEREQYARRLFAKAWNEINGHRAKWPSNPWLWVVSYRLLEQGGTNG